MRAPVPRTLRNALPLQRGALQTRGPGYFASNRDRGSAQQREERCSASGKRDFRMWENI